MPFRSIKKAFSVLKEIVEGKECEKEGNEKAGHPLKNFRRLTEQDRADLPKVLENEIDRIQGRKVKRLIETTQDLFETGKFFDLLEGGLETACLNHLFEGMVGVPCLLTQGNHQEAER